MGNMLRWHPASTKASFILCSIDILQLVFHIFSVCSDNLNLEMIEGCLQTSGLTDAVAVQPNVLLQLKTPPENPKNSNSSPSRQCVNVQSEVFYYLVSHLFENEHLTCSGFLTNFSATIEKYNEINLLNLCPPSLSEIIKHLKFSRLRE